MKPCPECSTMVEENVYECPECGYPIKNETRSSAYKNQKLPRLAVMKLKKNSSFHISGSVLALS